MIGIIKQCHVIVKVPIVPSSCSAVKQILTRFLSAMQQKEQNVDLIIFPAK